MKTELVYVDSQGYCNVYDISTYEQLQETFGDIISNLGGDTTKILGMKKLSEFTSILLVWINYVKVSMVILL